MAEIKYIAEGFESDAQKLLKDFVDCGSLEFKPFSDLWKKHNFVCVFMGRANEKEFREFIYEIYELTLNYFDSSVLEFQVGSIYLLYALFCNQNLVSPINIRMTPEKYQILLNILDIAEQKKIGTLHYVIDYLLDNCIDYVAFPSMFGPCSKKSRKDYYKPNIQDDIFLAAIDQYLITFHESNMLDEIKGMYLHYQNLKDKHESQSSIQSHDVTKEIEDFKNKLNCLLNINKSKETESNSCAKIGSKRAKLKKNQFERKIIGRHGISFENSGEDTTDNESLPTTSKKTNRCKLRRHTEKKIGRPRKTIKISPVKKSKNRDKPLNFKFLPSVIKPLRRGPIGRKKVSYLKPYDQKIKILMDEEIIDFEECSDLVDEKINQDDGNNDGDGISDDNYVSDDNYDSDDDGLYF